MLVERAELRPAARACHALLSGDYHIMTSPEQRIVEGYQARGLTLALAETDSGGLAGYRITNVPGSSKVFPGGVTAYSNRVKINLLGVPEELLRAHGAVSAECAQAMADGVRRALGSDVGVAATGIAGPTGGSAEKPPGTVYIAISREGERRAERRFVPGDRMETRAGFAEAILQLAAGVLDGADGT
jgi:nicotinamide-nucleotide amidase